MSRVVFKERKIYIDGTPTQIISGAIHYFRVLPELWRDRLEKLALCGFNCVETYMSWNLHEPQEGQFNFTGMLDFVKYIKTAQELGLYVIVRPGPYICAEWDNGGFPYWLMKRPGLEWRRMNKPYLDAVKNYFDQILPMLRELQIDNGGPVIAMQLENEYGSYGHDKEYIATLKQWYLDAGLTVPLFTGDGAGEIYLQNGMLPGTPALLTGGSLPQKGFDLLKKYQPDTPPFFIEFWLGWFDYWNNIHHTRPAEECANEFDDVLRNGGSVNVYMFHGGTNFNFWAGANQSSPDAPYTCDTTSYDYDAPLSECGDPTPKYYALQAVVKKYHPEAKTGNPVSPKKLAYGKFDFTESARLMDNLDNLGTMVKSKSLKTMEEMGQAFGFIHYRTFIPGPLDVELKIPGVKDIADVFVNGKKAKTFYRTEKEYKMPLSIPETGVTLDIFVQALARVNYGYQTGIDFKGLTMCVMTNQVQRFDWEIWPLPMTDLSRLQYGSPITQNEGPAFHRVEFTIDDVADTFVKFPGKRGVIWINGFNLGRYFDKGPSKTLYVPAPLLKKGKNEAIVFEADYIYRPYIQFVDKPQL